MPAGGGPFYQKVAVEGTKTNPVPDIQKEERKSKLMENQRQHYEAGNKNNDPRFNLVGGTFKGASVLRAAHFSLDLPDKDADKKRLKQKDVHGKGFDTKFGFEDYRKKFEMINQKTLEASTCSFDRPTDSRQMRRSI